MNRADMRETRFDADGSAPEIDDGEALLAVDSFGLTTNNITYVVLGEAMEYRVVVMQYGHMFLCGEQGLGHLVL